MREAGAYSIYVTPHKNHRAPTPSSRSPHLRLHHPSVDAEAYKDEPTKPFLPLLRPLNEWREEAPKHTRTHAHACTQLLQRRRAHRRA